MVDQNTAHKTKLPWLSRQINMSPLHLRARFWRWNDDADITPFMGFAVVGITVIYALVLQKSLGLI
ncbi:MAG: hypothetical protein P1V97_05445 [Planctomycetota bacterium]|nr:hypothetical protein [Planctomycetota bacterium]